MKKTTLIISFLLFALTLFAQEVKRIEDKSLRAHNERMVFKKWGEFRPNPKYFLGIQISPHYPMVWGWAAPRQNKRYKQGADIRPLKPTGLQNQRYLAAYTSYKNAETIKEKTDIIGEEALQEVMYYNSTLAKVDPIYLLYFREVLKPIADFHKSNPYRGRILNPKVIDLLKKGGVEEKYVLEMEILKDRLTNALNNDMERGQRLIFYHRILKDFRILDKSLNNQIGMTTIYQRVRDRNNNSSKPIDAIDYSKFKGMNDYELMQSIIHQRNK